jgi:hypothetical protein
MFRLTRERTCLTLLLPPFPRRAYLISIELHHAVSEPGNLQVTSRYFADDVGTITDLATGTAYGFSTSSMDANAPMFFINRGLYRGNFDA